MLSSLLSFLLVTTGFLYENPAADRLIHQAVESTYNLQLDDARASALALERQFPDHPAGYTLFAETYWWEAQMDPGSLAIENAYYAAQKLAAEKGLAALRQGKYPKAEIIAYLASLDGSYARFELTQKGAYFNALKAGLRAHKYAEEVFAMDKDYYDIYVGVGAYNYFTGSLPSVIKPFAYLMGAKGNRDVGIDQLKTGMSKARYSQTEARIVYYTAMLQDKNWPEAFGAVEKLRSDYNNNFILYRWVTECYLQQGQSLAGEEYFEKVFGAESRRSPVLAQYALLEKVRLQNAGGRHDDAIRTLERVKAIPGGGALIAKKIAAMQKILGK